MKMLLFMELIEDLRFVIGLLFLAFGVILIALGILSPPEATVAIGSAIGAAGAGVGSAAAPLQAGAPISPLNLNLYTGIGMTVFSLLMIFFAVKNRE